MSKTNLFHVRYFFRRPNPAFFSIEKVFKQLISRLKENYGTGLQLDECYFPYYSKPVYWLLNVLFAKRNQTTINHVTGDVHYGVFGFSRKGIIVLTIHDTGLLKSFSKYDIRYWWALYYWFKWPAQHADAVTVISEAARDELAQLIPGCSRKINVIPNFVDPDYFPVPFVFRSQKPVLLFVGTTLNKNLERMAEALSGLSVDLHIVGPLLPTQIECLQKWEISYTQQQSISAEQLRLNYVNCDIVVFPSTYEGFGLPILEGQAIGRPVITSNRSPMREVAGAGAELVDPFDVLSIRDAVLRLCTDSRRREILIQNGFQNVQRYNIDVVAAKYYQLYHTLLQTKTAAHGG